jgi:radical SAM protein with 4Fe4S-binding SPASM domain
MKHRFENFGSIISSDDPPLLVFVDRQYMLEMGFPPSERWQNDNEAVDLLSAPVEVHFACTNSCSLGCSHCYMDSGKESPSVLDTEQFKKTLDTLAQMGVFHVAMGGGEALERNDLFELAAHARKIGIVPNLTTNGTLITSANAEKLSVFGQVNLSLDGVGEIARTFRDKADFEVIDKAFDILQRAGITAGINCVVGRNNLKHLQELFSYAASKEISEIELLRFKPSGRANGLYNKHRLSPDQNRSVYPLFQKLAELYKVKTKIDCSFVPMLVFHRPPAELLEAHCVCGCEAGNFLLGAHSDGRICGCSFLPALDISLNELPDKWNSSNDLRQYRNWSQMTYEPCRSCDYLRFCKGGCHAVSLGVTGDMNFPDPDCPWVLEYNSLNEQMV